MTEQYQERLHRLMSELDAITQGMWHADSGVMGQLIELNEWRGKLAELEKDMRSEVMG